MPLFLDSEPPNLIEQARLAKNKKNDYTEQREKQSTLLATESPLHDTNTCTISNILKSPTQTPDGNREILSEIVHRSFHTSSLDKTQGQRNRRIVWRWEVQSTWEHLEENPWEPPLWLSEIPNVFLQAWKLNCLPYNMGIHLISEHEVVHVSA